MSKYERLSLQKDSRGLVPEREKTSKNSKLFYMQEIDSAGL